MNGTIEYKKCYEKFRDALCYINKHIDDLKKDVKKWKTIQRNFKSKYEEPLDKAWEALNDEDKKKMEALHIHRKESAEEKMARIRHIIKMFNGKIIKRNSVSITKRKKKLGKNNER